MSKCEWEELRDRKMRGWARSLSREDCGWHPRGLSVSPPLGWAPEWHSRCTAMPRADLTRTGRTRVQEKAMVPSIERTSQGLGAGWAARRGFLKAEAASDDSSLDMCYSGGPPSKRKGRGRSRKSGWQRGRGREIEGTNKWPLQSLQPPPRPSCLRRAGAPSLEQGTAS